MATLALHLLKDSVFHAQHAPVDRDGRARGPVQPLPRSDLGEGVESISMDGSGGSALLWARNSPQQVIALAIVSDEIQATSSCHV